LAKPGRDPREEIEEFSFASGIEKPSDLRQGMMLPGIVSNITAFGAFVDIGVHQDGLAHISELSNRYVKDPTEIVKLQQKVMVRVLEVDLERNRISLSMKTPPPKGDREKGKTRKKSVKEQKPRPNRPGKNNTDKTRPFHNPFADLLKNRNR